MRKMSRRTVACAVLGATAVLALVAVVSFNESGPFELLSNGNSAKLLKKLNEILMKRLEEKTKADKVGGPESKYAVSGAENGAPDAQYAISGAQTGLKMTKAQLEKAACDDGEPCKLNQMPVLKYIPSTGNWDVVSAGNPEVVWESLMSKARARDKGVKAPSTSAADARTEDLVQVDSVSPREQERAQLEAKLKSLLRAKLAKRRAVVSTSDFADSSADQGNGNGPVHTIKQLASDLHESRNLVEARHNPDTDRMQRIEDRLAEDYRLHSLCRHRQMVVHGLGVLKHSSLEGCVRQLKYRMGKAEDRLKSAVSELAFDPRKHQHGMELSGDNAEHDQGGGDGYAVLHAKKHRLSEELSTLKKDHNELQEELKQQKERITQLTQSKKHGGHSGAWSPPVPPGLPPGYNGPLLAKGSTHVPLSRPPGM